MQTITIILITLTVIQLWIDWINSFPFDLLHRIRMYLDFKPFNCSLCLSLWLGVIISLIFLDPIFLSLPLLNKITEKIIY